MRKDVNNFLAHYGVQGMKWGRRKDRDAINQNYNQASLEINRRQAERRMNTTLTDQTYRQLDAKDVVIKKGQVVKRTTANPFGDAQTRDLFVSTNEADATMYRGLLPTGNTGGIPSKKHEGYYETTYEATKDLKSPSEKKRVDAYVRLMDVPEIKLHNGEAITGREYMRRQGLGDTVDKLDSRQLALTYYGQLAVTQGIRDEPLNTAYFNSMRNKGYSALVDDNDRNIISKQPLLVFDAYENLKTVHVKQLTTEDVHTAQATLVPPSSS
jgi:hypothetical protein